MADSFDISQITPGQIVKGRVAYIGERDVFVECGFKSEVSVPLAEFDQKPNIGDEVEIAIIGEFAQGIVGSKAKADRKQKLAELKEKFNTGEPVKGTIVKALFAEQIIGDSRIKVLKGFLVDLGTGLKGFLPASQVEIGKIKVDPLTYVNKEFEFKIINKKEGQFILSRKALLQEELERKKKEFFANVKVGDEVTGVVKKITQKYIVLDVEGVNAVLSIADLSWKKIDDINSVVHLGDTITVKVLAVNEEKGFIRVGRKQIEKDPFVEFQNTHKEGDLVSGKVIAVRDRYAVIELADGVKGVLLATDYSWSTKVRSLKTEIKVGEIVKGKIINFDTEKRLVRIGIKQLLPDPWENIEERYKRGQIIRGRVNTITDRAIFVGIMEGVEGVVPRNEVSWNEEEPNLRKMFSKGQMVEALIVKINKEGRLLYLSIKRLEGNPWQRFKEMNPKGSVVEGVVSEVRDDRIIVDLGSGVTGYVLASNASMERGIVLSEKFKVGDSVKAVVVRVVPEEKIVELSIKAYEKKLIDEAKKDFVVSEPTEVKKGTIADLLKLKGINVVSSTPKGEKKETKRGKKKSSE